MLGSGASTSPVVTNMHNQSARSFDGSDQSVNIDGLVGEIANVVETDGTEFSISLWCKLNASISSSVTLFKCRDSGAGGNQILFLYHATHNEYRFVPNFGGVADICNGGTTNANGDSYEGDGIWHHLVGTISATDDTTEFWIDGVKKESITGIGTLAETINAVSLCWNGADGSYFDGDVKDVAIYGRQLTDAEIAILYNSAASDGDKGLDLISGSHVSNTGLIAHFRFEEKSGTVAINEVGVRTEGSEEVTNGDFASDTGWSKQDGWEISGGTANFDFNNADGSNRNIYQNPTTSGRLYKLTFEITSLTQGRIRNVSTSVSDDTFFDTVGVHTQYYTSTGTTLYLKATDDAILSIDNVSVKEYTTTDGFYVNAPAITTNIP